MNNHWSLTLKLIIVQMGWILRNWINHSLIRRCDNIFFYFISNCHCIKVYSVNNISVILCVWEEEKTKINSNYIYIFGLNVFFYVTRTISTFFLFSASQRVLCMTAIYINAKEKKNVHSKWSISIQVKLSVHVYLQLKQKKEKTKTEY